jgi:hypothetical protein
MNNFSDKPMGARRFPLYPRPVLGVGGIGERGAKALLPTSTNRLSTARLYRTVFLADEQDRQQV